MTIEEYLKRHKMTLAELSQKTQISVTYLSKIKNHRSDTNPSKTIQEKLKKLDIECDRQTPIYSKLIRENEELKTELKRLKKAFIKINDNLNVLKNIIENSNNLTQEIKLKNLKTRKRYIKNQSDLYLNEK